MDSSADPEAKERLEALASFRYETKVEIVHGPFLRTRGYLLGKAEGVATIEGNIGPIEVASSPGGQPTFATGYVRVDWDDNTTFDVAVSPFIWKDKGIDASGGSSGLKGSFVSATRSFSVVGTTPSLEIGGAAEGSTVAAGTLEGNGRMLTDYLYIGDFEVSLPEMRMVGAQGGPAVNIADAKISSTISESQDGQSLKVGVGYSFGRFEVAEIAIEDIVLGFGVANLDREFIEWYTELVQNPEALMAIGSSSSGELGDMLVKLLHRSPSLSIDPLQLKFNGEEAKLTLSLALDGSSIDDPAHVSRENYAALRMLVSGKAELSVGRALAMTILETQTKSRFQAQLAQPGQNMPSQKLDEMVKQQATAMIQIVVQQGFVVDKGKTLSAHAEVKSGQVLLNGQPLGI